MPQFLLKSVTELLGKGHHVCVVEYNNISGHYIIQKNKLRNLCDFRTLDGDKAEGMKAVLDEIKPDVVHLQEMPERFLDEETASLLYNLDRTYQLVETTHSSVEIDKKYFPDRFAFVSKLHFQQYGGLNIISHLTEYPIEQKQRPDRTKGLRKLGIDPGKKHILHVGLFAKWKGQHEIFELARRLPQYQFHFVGNQAPNFAEYWEPLMENKPNNCIIWGEREDVDDFYASMDLFYFPSTVECAPIVLREALSWQMPILMRDLPAYCGTYDNVPGVDFITNDPEANCQKIISLLSTGEIGLDAVYMDIGIKDEKEIPIDFG
jgi:glycosyltransferase involved in cell wall biosynthesis